MTRNNTWRFIVILLVLAWSAYEIYPPQGTDLVTMFREKAVQTDDTFKGILTKLDGLQKENNARQFGNVIDAIGTNDVQKYFPFYDAARTNAEPTRYILNRLQRDGAGKIKLGLDLQGGTSFLVGLDFKSTTDTNALGTNAPLVDVEVKNQRILSQAIEVLRKRVDKFGVAEPIIQPAGNDRIEIQLPGLSEADKDNARTNIQKAAYLEFRMVHPDSDNYVQQGMSEPGYEFKRYVHHTRGNQEVAGYLVRKKAEHGLNGKYVKFALARRDTMSGLWEI